MSVVKGKALKLCSEANYGFKIKLERLKESGFMSSKINALR